MRAGERLAPTPSPPRRRRASWSPCAIPTRAPPATGSRGCVLPASRSRKACSHDEACEVTLGHVLRVTEGRPAVTLKLAVGSDGLMPRGEGGAPTWITGQIRPRPCPSLARPHRRHPGRPRHRARRQSEPHLPASRHGHAARRCGWSSTAACARRPTRRLFEDEMVPVWFICARRRGWSPMPPRCRSCGAEIIPVADRCARPSRHQGGAGPACQARHHPRSSSKAARRSPTCFLDADLVDEAVIYQGSTPAGSDGLLPFVSEGLDRLTDSGHFTLTQERTFGPDRMTWWQRQSEMFTGIVTDIGTVAARDGTKLKIASHYEPASMALGRIDRLRRLLPYGDRPSRKAPMAAPCSRSTSPTRPPPAPRWALETGDAASISSAR